MESHQLYAVGELVQVKILGNDIYISAIVATYDSDFDNYSVHYTDNEYGYLTGGLIPEWALRRVEDGRKKGIIARMKI